MRKFRLLVLITVTVAAVVVAAGASAPPPDTKAKSGSGAGVKKPRTPVAINGRLRVCGIKLCNQYGRPIQLRGMSTPGLQWHRQCVNDASLTMLAKDWNADVLRIAVYIQEGGYETAPRYYTDLVNKIIGQATARGMYVIVDWHVHNPGDPFRSLALAKRFLTEVATRHRDQPNVLYEVANEPSGVGWLRIRDYHEKIIPVVRAADPDSVILLGTRQWSSLGIAAGGNENEVIKNPVRAKNVMYTFHFYAASHGWDYLKGFARAAKRLPLFVTEFGTQEFTGIGADFAMGQRYLDVMAREKISWVNWEPDDRSGGLPQGGLCSAGVPAPSPPAVGGGPSPSPSPGSPSPSPTAGAPDPGADLQRSATKWVRERMRIPPDNFPTR